MTVPLQKSQIRIFPSNVTFFQMNQNTLSKVTTKLSRGKAIIGPNVLWVIIRHEGCPYFQLGIYPKPTLYLLALTLAFILKKISQGLPSPLRQLRDDNFVHAGFLIHTALLLAFLAFKKQSPNLFWMQMRWRSLLLQLFFPLHGNLYSDQLVSKDIWIAG